MLCGPQGSQRDMSGGSAKMAMRWRDAPPECLQEITLPTDRHLDSVLAHKKYQLQRDASRAAELRDIKASSLKVDRRPKAGSAWKGWQSQWFQR